MGAKKQGRRTRKRAMRAIDAIGLVLSSVEADPVRNLRALEAELLCLDLALLLLDAAGKNDAAEMQPFQSVQHQLEPLIEMVREPDVLDPPFSPDIRQRVGYSLAVLTSMRGRLAASDAKLSAKSVGKTTTAAFEIFTGCWARFRTDPTLGNLSELSASCQRLGLLYWSLGIPESEPRVRGHRNLCDLLRQALDREGTLSDVPALMRKITTGANGLARPTLAEHRAWLTLQLA